MEESNLCIIHSYFFLSMHLFEMNLKITFFVFCQVFAKSRLGVLPNTPVVNYSPATFQITTTTTTCNKLWNNLPTTTLDWWFAAMLTSDRSTWVTRGAAFALLFDYCQRISLFWYNTKVCSHSALLYTCTAL